MFPAVPARNVACRGISVMYFLGFQDLLRLVKFSYVVLLYTEKKVIRGHFSNSFLIYKPCAKLNDFFA